MTPRVRTSFIVDTLDFLYKGGRLTRTQALVGNVLQIHPRIEVVDGKMCVPEKFRGSKSKANARLLEWATANKARIDDNWISVTHCHDGNRPILSPHSSGRWGWPAMLSLPKPAPLSPPTAVPEP